MITGSINGPWVGEAKIPLFFCTELLLMMHSAIMGNGSNLQFDCPTQNLKECFRAEKLVLGCTLINPQHFMLIDTKKRSLSSEQSSTNG